ncbi:MAG: molybdopterin-dependent oxidoreductase [Chloroflexi bacterium]|nr:molybdopterin-dependent oxidoreductase [Chloroflexota bacterium]
MHPSTDDRDTITTDQNGTITRRTLIKTAALLGGSGLLASLAPGCIGQPVPVTVPEGGVPYPNAEAVNQLYTVCLNCNTGCGIKAKIVNGVAAKIDGNPFSPMAMTPHLPYKTSVFQTAQVDAAICPKGQAGVVTAYDPYRITRVLKRAGKRGENTWVSIPFDQAIAEIVEGGTIFKNVPGEENRQVTGLKEIWALRDPRVAQELAADAGKVAKKEITLDAFKAKHQANLKYLIDPNHPDFGPLNNQLVFAWGRLKGGRSEFITRFTRDAFGSTNAHGHTTVCQGSLYFTGKAMSEQFVEGKWTGGKKFYWQADTGNSEFIIFVGASPFEGNYGPPLRTPKITNGLVSGDLKYAVVDPRLSKTASKAWKWLPGKPGSEAALALGLIRWVIENKRYDERYLRNANRAAATADKEPNWTNAVWLVKIEKDGHPGAFLRASEIGLPTEKRKTAAGADWTFDPFVAMVNGTPAPFDPYDEKTAVEGDLFVKTDLQGVPVKSGMQLLLESASERTIEQVAEITGLNAKDIADVAREFTSHGKKAAADIHRGVSQHTNGFYNVFAWFSLNLLIGNYDWKGGMAQLSTWDISGTKPGQPYAIGKIATKAAPWGISIIRHDVKFEETTLFEGKYPARRPFYPLSSDIYQEIIPSIGDAYPYPVKALILYMGSPVYSLPAGNTNIDVLVDVNKLPLFIASDIVIGETSMYADYIFPDLSYLERWEMQGSHPSVTQKIQPIRQPVIAPLVETAKVFGNEMPIGLESMLMGLAERLGLPGFGKDGIDKGMDLTWPEEYYIRMTANVAAGEKADGSGAVPDATDEEVALFLESRRHLPKTVFDADRWRAIAGDKWWRKVVYVLNRGGRFDDFEQGYDGNQLKNKFGTLINIYQEKSAKVKHSMTGKPLSGVAVYLPGPFDALGNPINDEASGYDLRMITYREIAMTKSRTASNYWLLSLLPENAILVNKRDADRLGLKTGDQARIFSASNPDGIWDLKNGKTLPLVGKVRVIQGIRPGVIAFSLGHGHWAYGASDVVIDGQTVKADPRRGTGIHANAAMRIDPVIKNTTLGDLFGGSAVFYDTVVKLIKV